MCNKNASNSSTVFYAKLASITHRSQWEQMVGNTFLMVPHCPEYVGILRIYLMDKWPLRAMTVYCIEDDMPRSLVLLSILTGIESQSDGFDLG